MSIAHPTHTPNWDRWQRVALIAAVVGIVVFVVLAFTPLAGSHGLMQSATSYLVAFNFWLGLPLGCLALLMMQYLTGGAWGVLLRPVLESGTRTFLLLAILFVPLVVALFAGAASPYVWARPLSETASGEVLTGLQSKAHILNPSFVLIRAIVYFICWFALAYFLCAWSARWRSGNAAAGARLPALSGPGLVLFGITVTFAAIDWVMSLEPFWHSTIYPPIYAVGHILEGFAFATVAAVLLSRYPPLAGRITPKHLRDLGGLMLAFVMIWSYLAFSQFLLIWVGNLPDEIPYYLKRIRGGWQWVALAVIGLHFALPFVALLFREVKDNPNRLLLVALGLLVMRFVDVLWWIEPAFAHDGWPFFWLLDIAATVGLGGLWTWWFLSRLRRVPLLIEDRTFCEPGRDGHA